MKSTLRLAALILSLVAANAFAGAASDTKTLPVKAHVVSALTLTKVTDLDFGDGYIGDSAKTIAPTDTGAGAFTVGGEKDRSITVAFSATSITLLRAGGTAGTATDEIAVNGFQTNAPAKLDATGAAAFNVGATRAALTAKTAGDYAGSVDVTVAY